MTLRRAIRLVRPVAETVLAGLLLGVVVMAFASQLATSSSSGAVATELPLARAYMLALIRNDLDTMAELGPSADTLGQAINFQKRADVLKNLKIDTLTYLGGSALGGAGIHVYVVQTEDPTGIRLVPFSLTVFQGRVVRVE